MSPDLQRIALATAIGWQLEYPLEQRVPYQCWIPPGSPAPSRGMHYTAKPAGFEESRDALEPVYELLRARGLGDVFTNVLFVILNDANCDTPHWMGPTMLDYIAATPAQQCEAAVRALGLWEDDK